LLWIISRPAVDSVDLVHQSGLHLHGSSRNPTLFFRKDQQIRPGLCGSLSYSIAGEVAAAAGRDQANSFLVTMVRVPGVSFSSTASLGLSPRVPGARSDGRFEQAIQASVTAPGFFFQPKSRNRTAIVSNLLLGRDHLI